MRVRVSSLIFLVIALVRAGSLGAQTTAQIRHEIIRGRVTTDSGVAITGADVIVTMAPSAETFTALTAAGGAYSVDIPNGTGEYLVYFGALGRRPFKQRITRAGGDSTFTANAKLAAVVTTVGAVRVQATRPRPVRSVGLEDGKGTSGVDRTYDGVAGALAPELQGNLDAMASMVPGLVITPNGPSALGLGADNNRTSLNGLDFSGGDLPRDAKTATRFQLSPWDPSSGGFAGALVAVTLLPGDNVTRRHGHVTLDNPSMQFSDRIASRTGQTFSNVLLSEGATGALVLDKYFYNYGAQVSRNAAPVSSLLSLDADVLAHAGLSADSADRLVRILGAQGVPLRAGGAADVRTTTTATFMERIDYSPSAVLTGHPATRTWSLTGYGRYSRSEAATLAPTITPAFAGQTTGASGGLQGIYAATFGSTGQYLNETTTGISFSSTRGSPYLDTPGGNVLVSSSLPNGAGGLSSVAFGGNGMLASDMRTLSWETVNQTTFMPTGQSTLPLHLYFQSRFTGFDQSVPANRFGRFDFASLEDLAAGRASAYSRTLNSPDRSGGEWIGAGAVGGSWTRGRVVYTGGARIDANVFLEAPRYNAAVDQAFGARTDHAPNDVGLSPRLGFTWFYNGKTGPGYGYITNGTTTLYRGQSSIRGGIGEFRSVLPATLLSDATGATGLADATRQLRCVGAAAPIADWQAFTTNEANIPSHCADGASAFTDSASAVTMFDRAYSAPRTWKGTLGWTHWNDLFYVTIDGTYAVNLRQAGVVDLNFAGTPQFRLDDEGNRPVFVSPSAVVGGTGTASTIGARSVNEFGRVLNRVSDLRGDARQVSVYVMPGASLPFNYGIVSLGYTYVDARSQSRGFDQSAAGDPRNIEWASSFVPRHSIVAQALHQFARPDIALTAAFRASSGLPYTPIVAGDINGDGSSGDRAFVFDPTTARDAAVANGLRDLLANGSGSARDCLRRQIGEIAGRNSCGSSWSATLNAALVYTGDLPGAARRAHVSLSMLNVLGGLDELIHGVDQLHGWGGASTPDAVLYRVRGFDAATHRYLYDVNGRFGSASPATSMLRAPFRVSLDVSIDLGRSPAVQGLEQSLRIRPGLLGTRAPADTIKKRYIVSFTDIYAAMLRMSDSLALSRDQIQKIQERRFGLTARVDTLYAGLGVYLAALPAKYDEDATIAHINATRDVMWQAIYAEVPFLNALLTPGQVRRLPPGMNQLVTVKGYKGRFFF